MNLTLQQIAHQTSTYRSLNPLVEKFNCTYRILADHLSKQDPTAWDVFFNAYFEKLCHIRAYIKAVNPHMPIAQKGEVIPNYKLSRYGSDYDCLDPVTNNEALTNACLMFLKIYYQDDFQKVMEKQLWRKESPAKRTTIYDFMLYQNEAAGI